jgi:integrase
MASFKKMSSGAVQVCVRNKLLPKPFWATFDNEEQARGYAQQLEGLLAQGVVPATLLERTAQPRDSWVISRCVAEYLRDNAVPHSDIKLLETVGPGLKSLSTAYLNYDWAEGWIREMKRGQNLAPSTIRHRHGALARCFDWMVRKHPDVMVQNPLRLLKRGFAVYTPEDTVQLALQGKAPKCDQERDRRLVEGEESRILTVLANRPEDRTFFITALESAMRMRECYTLDLSQVDLDQRTIYLDRTKNGDQRQVPLSRPLIAALGEYMREHRAAIAARSGRLFSYWNGDRSVAALDDTTSDVSRVFSLAFAEAEISGLHFHDLRHEATCRLYQKTTLSDVLIAKITGHRDLRTLKRYASLRGSDLAQHLW